MTGALPSEPPSTKIDKPASEPSDGEISLPEEAATKPRNRSDYYRKTAAKFAEKICLIFAEFNFWLVLGTWILAVVAIVSLRDSSNSLQRSQRAWVGPNGAKIDGTVALNQPVSVQMTVMNTGREPALNFLPSIFPGIYNTTAETEVSLQKEVYGFVQKCRATPTRIGAQVLFPSVGLGTGFSFTTTFPKEKIDQEVIRGNKVLIAVGCLAYDTAGKTHHSTFCYFFKNGTTKPDNLNLCFNGNTAD